MYEIPKFNEHLVYDGSRIFTWLADMCGLSVDLVNFLVTQVIALLLASLMRSKLHQSKVSIEIRHAFGLIFGLFFGYFCFGQQAIHIAGLPALCYIVIRTQNPQNVQRLVMIVALSYLSIIHMHRLFYDYGSYSLDITGPLMIITQKVTTLAFSIHDGLSRDEKDLSTNQKRYAVNNVPTALEYFSYVLHFQGLMAGPMVLYKDYMEFIEGSHFLKHSNGKAINDKAGSEFVVEPSPMKAVVKKVMASVVCALIFMKFISVYPIKTIKDDDFINNTSFLYKFWFMMMSTTVIRFKYYHAWLLADAICNNSGLGFNGYDKDGVAKWDMISNINVIPFELGSNFRDSINAWNIGTNVWLRSVVYERVPKKYGTVLTFGLSALWHGFYPGYYLTFSTGALIVMAARTARRLFRHRFQKTAFMRKFYDVLTILVTRVFMGYATFPFVLLEFKASLHMYLKVYMCLHLVALFTVFALPKLLRGEKRSESKRHTVVPSTSNDNTSNGLNDAANDQCDDNIKDKQHNSFKDDISIESASGERLPEEEAQISYLIKEKIDMETRNIEEFIDKTVTGIVELKDDLMRLNESEGVFIQKEGLRKRNPDGRPGSVDEFIKHEIDVLNAAVQQANVLPAVLSNGHAK